MSVSNTFYDGYCVHKLPCGYCERTGKLCFKGSTVTWSVGTGTPYSKDIDSGTYTAQQAPGTTTEAWNGLPEVR